ALVEKRLRLLVVRRMQVDGHVEFLGRLEEGPEKGIVVKPSLARVVDERAHELQLVDTAAQLCRRRRRVLHRNRRKARQLLWMCRRRFRQLVVDLLASWRVEREEAG